MDSLLLNYARSRQVPKRPGLTTSTCKRCTLWCARPPRHTACHSCKRTDAERSAFTAAIEATTPEPASIKAPREKPPLGTMLNRSMAMVEAIRRDFPNVKQTDLKPEWQAYW